MKKLNQKAVKTVNKSIATINAALAIIDKFPDLDNVDSSYSASLSVDPFSFLLEVIKSTAGYNFVIEILAKFIKWGVPELEIAVKSFLIMHIKGLLSCTLDPRIPDEILRDGVVFDLEQIDITDLLKYCPTDSIGQNYYFDNIESYVDEDEETDDSDDLYSTKENKKVKKSKKPIFKTADDLKYSKDFNCLLWYMKNKASFREVWGKKVNPDTNDLSSNNSDIKGIDFYWNSKKNKCKKSAGIVTLEYSPTPNGVKNALGNGMALQTPFNNCLHVFIGNVKEEYEEQKETLQKQYNENIKYIERKKIELEDAKRDKKYEEKKNLEFLDSVKQAKINPSEALGMQEIIDGGIMNLFQDKITMLQAQIDEKAQRNVEILKKIKNLTAEGVSYRPLDQNYYYRSTLLQFNIDYIWSVKLYDAKVITSQLIDALFGIFKVDLNLDYKRRFIQDEVRRMVVQINQNDTTVVNDCFFTFTNEDYNAMLEKAELNRANLFTIGDDPIPLTIDKDEILNMLNEVSASAFEDGDSKQIEELFSFLGEGISYGDKTQEDSVNISAYFNVIEQLLTNLAYVITSTIISPKIYLLIMVNLEIMGQDTNFQLSEFIARFKKLISDLIRMIRDMLISFILKELQSILGYIATQAARIIGLEQMQYYRDLLLKIFACFKGKTVDWTMDYVNYADIDYEENESPDTEC